jgi:hypothetical protein
MGTIIAASVLVPLCMAAIAYAVDKIEQGSTEQKKEKKISTASRQQRSPDDPVDLSGGMFGIL